MHLLFLCAGFAALSVTLYVLLDGFDLGAGALLLLQPHEKSKDHMVDPITPTCIHYVSAESSLAVPLTISRHPHLRHPFRDRQFGRSR